MALPVSVRDRRIYLTAEETPAEVKDYIVKMLTVQIQSEYADAPDRSGSVCPTVEEKAWVDFQIAQEKEHGLGVSRILTDFGVDPLPYIKEAESSVTAGERKLDYFRIRMEDWVERTMTRVLAERTGGIQSIAGLGASYVPLAVWHARNYVDEALGHTAQGVRYARDLVAQGRSAECQSAIDKFYASCLDIFGGVDTPNERRYLELGIKTLSNNQSRFLWIRSLERDLQALSLTAPAARWQGHRRLYPTETQADTQIYLDADEVPDAIRPLAARLLAGWVEAKYARQNDPAVFAAPTPEEKLAVAGQYRDDRRWGLEAARLLQRLGVNPDPLADAAERSLSGGRHKVDFLKQPIPEGWVAIAAHQLIAARVAQAASLATFGSSLVPLAVWSGRHFEAQAAIADAWRRRLDEVPDTAATRATVEEVVAQWYPLALDAFGGDDTANEAAYCAAGLKTAANGHVREIFVDLLRRDLEGLKLPLPSARRGRRHNYAPFARPGLAA
jgi:1,2-phenylacetyl-CoA epoxidase catalytic subunit